MPVVGRYESVVHQRLYGFPLVDALAQALALRGRLPPPLGEIEIRVIGQVTPVARRFEPPLLLWTLRKADGFVAFDGTYLREGGGGERRPLGPGRYQLQVRGEYYEPSDTIALDWVAESARIPLASDVRLRPAAAYPFPDLDRNRANSGHTLLRGSVLEADGRPVAGVTAAVTAPAFTPAWEFDSCLTGPTGDWAILLPDRPIGGFPAPVEVTLTYPDGATASRTEPVRRGTGHVFRSTGLRGAVTDAVGRPVPSAVITTSVDARRTTARPDGQWFLYFAFDQADAAGVTVTATTTGGASAPAGGVTVTRGAMNAVPTIHIP